MCCYYSAMAVNNSTANWKELIIFWETLSLFFKVFFSLEYRLRITKEIRREDGYRNQTLCSTIAIAIIEYTQIFFFSIMSSEHTGDLSFTLVTPKVRGSWCGEEGLSGGSSRYQACSPPPCSQVWEHCGYTGHNHTEMFVLISKGAMKTLYPDVS